MLALRTVTYCTENEETPVGVSHKKPDSVAAGLAGVVHLVPAQVGLGGVRHLADQGVGLVLVLHFQNLGHGRPLGDDVQG